LKYWQSWKWSPATLEGLEFDVPERALVYAEIFEIFRVNKTKARKLIDVDVP
jgi:hypothetical protein